MYICFSLTILNIKVLQPVLKTRGFIRPLLMHK